MSSLEPGAIHPCPCGLGGPYADCCGPIHSGHPAPTAPQLMRSRYSAFALGLADYLLESWHPSTRPDTLELDAETRWLRLVIESAEQGGPFAASGSVTFTAIGRTPEGRFEQRERSSFVREGGRWLYLDGTEPGASPP